MEWNEMEWIDGWSVFLLDTIELRAELYDLCRGQGSCEPVKFALPSGTGVTGHRSTRKYVIYIFLGIQSMHIVHILLYKYNIYWISIYMVI